MSETRSELDADVAAPTLDRATSFDILNNQHRRTIITLLAETPTDAARVDYSPRCYCH